jgi:alkylhydroperoxidase/carboxymuconolactone decarboxylase family protein YurZ
MDKSYVAITESINRGILELRKSAPDALAGFSAMARGAMAPGALSELHKELMALVRLRASREQVMEALAVAVYMGGGPSLMYAAEAVHAFDEFSARAGGPA